MDFSKYGGASKEWLAVQATMPPPVPGQSVLELRDATNAFREKGSSQTLAAIADQIELIDVAIPARDGFSLEGRLYWPRALAKDAKPALYLHLHGGGYLFGTLDSEDGTCATTALKAPGVVVLNLNYRHTPDYVYPTMWNDVQDTLVWIHETAVPKFGIDPLRVVVGGISAGAHMAASLVVQQRLGKLDSLTATKLPPIAGQVLMIPCVVNLDCYAPLLAEMASPEVSSLTENVNAPILPIRVVRLFGDLLMKGQPEGVALDPYDTKLNPGNATPEQVQGLPPSVFGICGLDPLRDEGLLYAKKLTEAGVPTDIHLFKGVPHGFRRFGEDLSVAKAWDNVMEQGILWTLSQPAATKEFLVKVHDEEA